MSEIICPECAGAGDWREVEWEGDNIRSSSIVTCPDCNGLGIVSQFYEKQIPKGKPFKECMKAALDAIDRTLSVTPKQKPREP